MAYFPNGISATILDMQCADCVLGDDACPIYAAQTIYNYEQFDDDGNDTKMSELLNELVDKNGICVMREMAKKHMSLSELKKGE